MFTQCTHCGTWFRVAPESLHAVHGLVRCGRCGTVFNARGTLCDEPPELASVEEENGRPQVSAAVGAEPEPAASEELAGRLSGARHGRLRRWAWRAAVIALVLIGAAQLVHAARRTLITWPAIGPVVASAYRFLGHPLAASPVLADYQIADASLTGMENGGPALRLSGLLVNRSERAQPLPLIDLKLMDRYGRTVARRLLIPHEYGAGSRTRLGPNLSLPLDVKLADPGPEAVGFALSVCKRNGGAVRCQVF